MSAALRDALVTVFFVAFALLAACAIDPTDGIAGVAGAGSLGSECSCPGSMSDCDGNQAQCQAGLSCLKTDNGNNVCTRNCPCPLNYVCKAAAVPGQRLACFKR